MTKRRSRTTVIVAVVAAFVMVALPATVSLVSSSGGDDDIQTGPREGFPGWVDENAAAAQLLLSDVGQKVGELADVLASGDEAALPAAQAEARAAILDAQALWETAPDHEGSNGVRQALGSYLVAVGAASPGSESTPGPPPGDLLVSATTEMKEAIAIVERVASGAT